MGVGGGRLTGGGGGTVEAGTIGLCEGSGEAVGVGRGRGLF